jgi:hypothetical protein
MIKTSCPPTIVMANSLESRCERCCQIVVRDVVRGLLSEQLLPERPLSERLLSSWLLSELLLIESQAGWSAVKLRD